MKTQLRLVVISLLAAVQAAGQTVVLQVDSPGDSLTDFTEDKFVARTFWGLGFLAGPGDSTVPVATGASYSARLNGQFLMRWSKTLANIIEFGYSYTQMQFRQTAAKTFPDTTLNRKQTLRCLGLDLALLQRVTWLKRPYRIGHFVEAGGVVDWSILMDHVRKNNLTDGTKHKEVLSKVPYRQPFYFSLVGRIGFGNFYLFGQYRLTRMIRLGFGEPRLPQLMIGLGITTPDN